MGLVKKLFRVASANGVQVLSGIIMGFLIPKYLTISNYASYKTFMLYAAYIGIFHMGFVDGLYVDYAGKEMHKLDIALFKGEMHFFLLAELLIAVLISIIGFLVHDYTIMLLGLAVIPFNLNTYFKRVYQATDQLHLYSRNIVIYSAVDAALCLLLIYVLKIYDAFYYCCIPIIANGSVAVASAVRLRGLVVGKRARHDPPRYAKLVKSGFIIMIGNIAVNLFYGIDRWAVKLFFQDLEFSQYSFAVSMLNIATTILQAVSITMFTYIAQGVLEKKGQLARDLLLALGGMASMAYFVLSLIVHRFLGNYVPSLNVIATSMAIFPYYLYINAIIINRYKLNHQEKKYLTSITVMLVVAAAADAAVLPLKSIDWIALATLVCFVVWYWVSRFSERKTLAVSGEELLYTIAITAVFLFSSRQSVWIGFAIYIGIWLLLTLVYLRKYIGMLRKSR